MNILVSTRQSNNRRHSYLRFFVIAAVLIMFIIGFSISPVNAAVDDDSAPTAHTVVIAFTDWHSAKGTQKAILNAVDSIKANHSSVIVCFNGDSETNVNKLHIAHTGTNILAIGNTVDLFRKDPDNYNTVFMDLAKKLTEKEGVYVVMGLGNHELAMNRHYDKSNILEKYINRLSNYVNSDKFHIINTGLPWKSSEPVYALYGNKILNSVKIENITFISSIGYDAFKEEIKFKKSNLYNNTEESYYNNNLVGSINNVSNEGDSKMLLIHGGYDKIQSVLGSLYLGTEKTYLITGHDHNKGFVSDPTSNNIREQLQPEPFGLGAAFAYANLSGNWFHDEIDNISHTHPEKWKKSYSVTAPAYLFPMSDNAVIDEPENNPTGYNETLNGYVISFAPSNLSLSYYQEEETSYSEDTGSGHYSEYPRTVTDGGLVSFGTSPIVSSVELPKGTSGDVVLIAESKVPAPEGKTAYAVFEINIPKYQKGESAVIKFKISVAELKKAGYTSSDICLYHYNTNGIWTKLSTTFTEKDGLVYYESKTTEFSPFAIIYEKEAAQSKSATSVPTATITAVTEKPSADPTYVEPIMPDTPVSTPTKAASSTLGLLGFTALLIYAIRKTE